MSDEKTQILIRALEASGSEREAKLARAILGETPAAAREATPAAPAAPAPETTATPAAEQLPPGIMTKDEMAAHEERRPPKSWREQQQQMAEGERYVESFKHHEGLS